MKKYINLLSMMALAGLVTFTSCQEDEIVIEVPDEEVVSDGFYLIGGSAPSATPAASGILSAGIVGNGDDPARTRSGYYETFVTLTAAGGGLQFATYANNEATTYGGVATTVTTEAGYDIVEVALAEDGAAITPLVDGLHHVVVDMSTNTAMLIPMYTWGLIGSATEGAWSSDTELATVSADGLTFSAENVILRSGELKFRYNKQWVIEKRIDTEAGYDDSNGFQGNSNFGGTYESLEAFGANLTAPEEGAYSVSLTFKNGELAPSATFTRTGDAPELTFDPNDYSWGIIGTATTTGWDADTELIYKGESEGTHKWVANFYLQAGEFKFRSDDSWSNELGIGSVTLSGGATAALSGDNNFVFDGTSTFYYVVISTADEGETWTMSFDETMWGVIGDATAGGWDADTDMTRGDDGVSYTITTDMTVGSYKFRANDSWDINMGGDAAALSLDGDNLSIDEAGSYLITLKTEDNGVTFMSSAVKQ